MRNNYFKGRWGLFERLIDKSIPFVVLILVIMIIIELFFKELALANHNFFYFLDKSILIIFVIDLIFKYLHLRDLKFFFKKYWMDIIVVFPFFLFFRLFESMLIFVKIPQAFESSQTILHTTFEIQKEISILLGDATKFSVRFRIYYLSFLRVLPKLIKILKIIPYERRENSKFFS